VWGKAEPFGGLRSGVVLAILGTSERSTRNLPVQDESFFPVLFGPGFEGELLEFGLVSSFLAG
jgi:hypothetical protein